MLSKYIQENKGLRICLYGFLIIGFSYLGYIFFKYRVLLYFENRTGVATVEEILFAPKAGKEAKCVFSVNGKNYNMYVPIASFENKCGCDVQIHSHINISYYPENPKINRANLDSGIILPSGVRCDCMR